MVNRKFKARIGSIQNARGSYMISMAIMMVIFIGLGSMIFEMHKSMALKTHLQSIADLSALAAAREYAEKEGAVTLNQVYATVKGVADENGHWLDSSSMYVLDKTEDGIMAGFFQATVLGKNGQGIWKDYQFTVFRSPYDELNTEIKNWSPAPTDVNSIRVVLKSDPNVVQNMFRILRISGDLKVEAIAQVCPNGSVALYGTC